MRESHSLLTMYASAERDGQRPWLGRRNKTAKKPTRGHFSNLWPFVHWREKTPSWDTEETQIPKSCRAENTEMKKPLLWTNSHFGVWEPRQVKHKKKMETCSWGKRLMINLGPIRRASFYQCVMIVHNERKERKEKYLLNPKQAKIQLKYI